jgi:hypothetical protein
MRHEISLDFQQRKTWQQGDKSTTAANNTRINTVKTVDEGRSE